MFRIKICGITNVEDALAAADAGADCIGLNFYRASPRSVDLSRAQEIRQAVSGRLLVAGVFVNAPTETILDIHDQLQLDLVQLSGNDPGPWIRQLAVSLRTTPIMAAVRLGAEGMAAVQAHIDASRPHLVLWDAFDPQQFGGTGRVADWSAAAAYRASPQAPPLILAGGLRPENVAEAIRAVAPQGVDTASGVESGPGKKDAVKVKAFVAAAQTAFDKLRDSH